MSDGVKLRRSTFLRSVSFFATMLTVAGLAWGQAGHLGHHPAPGGAAADPANPADPAPMAMPGAAPAAVMAPAGGMAGGPPAAAAGGGMGAGGMGAGMEDMMKQMGAPPAKEIYPSLMALPDQVTPEDRARIEQLAQDRIKTGAALLSSGLTKLSESTSDENYAVMQQSTEQMREGLAEFEAGLAARRVMAEGKAPRNLALDWFKREMNLASPVGAGEPRGLFGVSMFHLFTMVLLVAFALAMLSMYFFKMRRAAALFGRIEPDAKSATPWSSPAIAGAPGLPAAAGSAKNAG